MSNRHALQGIRPSARDVFDFRGTLSILRVRVFVSRSDGQWVRRWCYCIEGLPSGSGSEVDVLISRQTGSGDWQVQTLLIRGFDGNFSIPVIRVASSGVSDGSIVEAGLDGYPPVSPGVYGFICPTK